MPRSTIEAVPAQELPDEVHRDAEPNATTDLGAQPALRHGHDIPVFEDDRSTATTGIEWRRRLDVPHLATDISTEARHGTAAHRNVWDELQRGVWLANLQCVTERVAQGTHGRPGHNGIRIPQPDVGKALGAEAEHGQIQVAVADGDRCRVAPMRHPTSAIHEWVTADRPPVGQPARQSSGRLQ